MAQHHLQIHWQLNSNGKEANSGNIRRICLGGGVGGSWPELVKIFAINGSRPFLVEIPEVLSTCNK